MGRMTFSICALVVAACLSGAQQPQETQQHQGQDEASIDAPKADGQTRFELRQTSQIEQADLTAQQAMAVFSGLQVVLTFFGLLYIRNTLRATNRAVEEAQRGSEAAVQMVEASREQFFSERRPWMAQQMAKAVKPMDGFEFAFKFGFQNVGSSPAFDVAVVVDIDVDDYSFTPIETAYAAFLKSRMNAHKGGDVVFPDKDHMVTHHVQFSLKEQRRRDAAWAKRDVQKPGMTPRVFYAVLYRSPLIGADGQRTLHHTGGFFSIHDRGGEIVVGGKSDPDNLALIARRTSADFLIS